MLLTRKQFGKRKRKLRILRRHKKRCRYCGCGLGLGNMTLDHRMARVNGGIGEDSNLVPACARCNSKKGSQSEDEFVTWLSTAEGQKWLEQ